VRIETVQTIPVRVRLDSPIEALTDALVIVVRLRTDDGAEGLGHIVTLAMRHLRSFTAAIEELGELLIGEDPRDPERLYRKINPRGNWSGSGGTPTIVASALDIAVWDIAAKSASLPLYRLLGGFRDRVPTYASVRLGRNKDTAQLAETARSLIEDGWTGMKLNLGAEATPDKEVDRVKMVRGVIGPNAKLMVDVNQNWTVSQSIRIGRRLEEFELDWIEDPTAMHDVAGHEEIARELATPIAIGESYYGITPWRELMERRAFDIANVDTMHVGGITPFRKVAAMAEIYGVQVASHVQHEVNAHVIAAIPNGLIVEEMTWSSPVFRGIPKRAGGELVLSDRPGHGLELDEDYVRANLVE
jgi:L-alanine-DL-glutamate epimerase-like enolase superfamily enzyme